MILRMQNNITTKPLNNNNMKTAVEWLIEELKKFHHPTEAMIMYANQMFEKQIKEAYEQGEWNDGMNGDAEQYYNQKFKNSNVV